MGTEALALQFVIVERGSKSVKTLLNCLKVKRAVLVILPATIILFGFQNCSKANFSSPQATNASAGAGANNGGDSAYANLNQPHTNTDSCYTYLHQTADNIRLLFVVDQSGSNANSPGQNDGTDPNQTVRAGSIQAFYNDYQAKSGFSWGMIGFAGSSAYPYISANNSGVTPTFGNANAMISAITAFLSVSDGGYTPYQAALDMALQAIIGDNSAPTGTKYIVVFLSDGQPNPNVADSILAQDVQNIVSSKPGLVTFNTIYYGPGDATASGRLKMMATVGGGYFLDTNKNPSGKDFLISNVVNVPGSSCTP